MSPLSLGPRSARCALAPRRAITIPLAVYTRFGASLATPAPRALPKKYAREGKGVWEVPAFDGQDGASRITLKVSNASSNETRRGIFSKLGKNGGKM